MAAAPLPKARMIEPRDPGSRRRAYAVACLLGACIVLVPAYIALVLSSNSDAASDGAAAVPAAAVKGGTDRTARVTFRRTGGAIGMRILRDAPARTLAVQGREAAVMCGYQAEPGLSVVRRTLRWPSGRVTARVSLPERMLASMEFCSLTSGGEAVARVIFP